MHCYIRTNRQWLHSEQTQRNKKERKGKEKVKKKEKKKGKYRKEFAQLLTLEDEH